MRATVEDLGKQLIDQARKHKIRLSVAESCTGGRIATALTAGAGASQAFSSSIVSYSDEVKSRVLGVSTMLIETHTSVSPEVAIEMARCVKELMKADLGIATTGYLGPDGGADGTPPGVVYIGLSGLDTDSYQRLDLVGDRLSNAEEATRCALLLALELICRKA